MSTLKKIIVVGGVSGVGKTTISKMLADKMGLPFYDADAYHPEANVEKMKSGHALNDADRRPWLIALAQHISSWERERGAVLACSALKEPYRELMQQGAEMQIIWIFLEGSEKLIADRLSKRKGHFFDPNLLKSQFEAYKRPSYGFYIDVTPTPETITNNIISVLTGKSAFGIIGAGVKGTQLARKLGRMQLKLSLFDPSVTTSKDSLADQQIKKYPELAIARGFTDLGAFAKSIKKPRQFVIVSEEKDAVKVLNSLKKFLNQDDTLINLPTEDQFGNDDINDYLAKKGVKLLMRSTIQNWEKEKKNTFSDPKMQEGFGIIMDFLKQK